jgi:hypothetical protein
MMEPKQYEEWVVLRRRLFEQERALAHAQAAAARGEPVDVEVLSIQRSEIRALRALSQAMIRRSVAALSERPGGQ